MTSNSGPLYEVTIFVEPDIADDVEQRIGEYARQALSDPSVLDCVVYAKSADERGRKGRVSLHTMASDDVLDDYIDGPAAQFEVELRAEFGDKVDIDTRILREDPLLEQSPETATNCLNCGSRLRGQYCGTCGQRSRSRLISLWELISDAFGDLLELDSRIWQTLIPLMIRPGRLTHDYLQGRRARYMPPFRMYLVLSLLFFLVAFFNPREKFSLFFEPTPETTAQSTDESAADASGSEVRDADQHRAEILDELREQGIIDDEDIETALNNDDLRVTINGPSIQTDNDCEFDESDMEDMPAWLSRRMTPERLERACEKTKIDGGRALFDGVVDNVPAALIVLLPLMAFVLKALYPLSKRYYVEHLLFFVHFHAFFFLMLTIQILLLRASGWIGIPEAIPILAIVASSFYIAIYLFIAMRRVYGQGRVITFIKYIALLVAYLAGFTATMLGALALAAFSEL